MELIGSGRACDVFALDATRVLRRERAGRSLEHEAAVMRHVRALGFPCPEVHDASGADLVLERIEGPTLTQHLLDDPTDDAIDRGARTLATLHHRLHGIAPMAHGVGVITHLDLHPDNVLLHRGGVVVIDWSNARHGDAATDVAMTWLILHPFRTVLDGAGLLLDRFLTHVGSEQARAGLATAAPLRLSDPNLSGFERDAVLGLLEREGPPS